MINNRLKAERLVLILRELLEINRVTNGELINEFKVELFSTITNSISKGITIGARYFLLISNKQELKKRANWLIKFK